MTERSRLLTVAEVKHLTGLAERTIRMLIADGRLSVIRPAGLRVVRVSETALQELISSVRSPGAASAPDQKDTPRGSERSVGLGFPGATHVAVRPVNHIYARSS